MPSSVCVWGGARGVVGVASVVRGRRSVGGGSSGGCGNVINTRRRTDDVDVMMMMN